MSDLTEMGQEAIAAVSRGVADGAPLGLPSMRLYGMSFARPMRPGAAPCLPSSASTEHAFWSASRAPASPPWPGESVGRATGVSSGSRRTR